MGKLIVERSQLTFYRNKQGETAFNASYTGGFGEPGYETIPIAITEQETGHNGILQNYTDAILTGSPLLAPGEEGILGLSISNAMHLSDWTGQKVNPMQMDEDLFYQLLQEKINASTFHKQTQVQTLNTENTY